MEKFNFDELTTRRHTGSLKWDTMPADEIIPLWVADMDFRTAPAIVNALQKRVASGIFGYVDIPDEYYSTLNSWFVRHHQWDINRSDVICTSGVVPAISAIIKAMTIPGDGVILQTPAYNCFFSSIRNNGCMLVDNPLNRVERSDSFSYSFNYEELEQVASDPRNKLLILCNPHNPTGRVWTRQELEKIRDICRCHHVTVVSDEIHCELTHLTYKYTPYATIDPDAIICCSPSKAFNTAGLQNAFIVCADHNLLARIDRAINDNEVCDVNPFGVTGLIAAYSHGDEWLNQLRQYLDENFEYLRTCICAELPDWKVCASEATYLAWIDVSGNGMTGDETAQFLIDKARVCVSSGSSYRAPNYIRINYACPRQRLRQALQQIIDAISTR